MSSKFPRYELYENLKESSKDVIITREQETKMVCTLSQLDFAHTNIVFSLILHHANINGDKISRNIPYGGKSVIHGKGCVFSAGKIPKPLMKILWKYIDMNS